jgi:hypothetical protein
MSVRAKKQSVRTHFQARRAVKRTRRVVCPGCGVRFVPARSWQKFHSENCRKRTWEKKRIIGLLISVLEESLERLGEA